MPDLEKVILNDEKQMTYFKCFLEQLVISDF